MAIQVIYMIQTGYTVHRSPEKEPEGQEQKEREGGKFENKRGYKSPIKSYHREEREKREKAKPKNAEWPVSPPTTKELYRDRRDRRKDKPSRSTSASISKFRQGQNL